MAEQSTDASNARIRLGMVLKNNYDAAKRDRFAIENRWLADLRQFKGQYGAVELKNIPAERSRAYTRMTRIKVKSATARLMDLVFPAGSDDNWSITPTPVPELQLSPDVAAKIQTQLGRIPSPQELYQVLVEQARHAAALMEKVIRDQLVDIHYRKLMKLVIQSGNLFGTGILKGPLLGIKEDRRWVLGPSGWQMVRNRVMRPFVEFTPVWEVYPDTTATTFDEAQFVFQRSVMPRHVVAELVSREDFFTEAGLEYLRTHKEGDYMPLHWEMDLRDMGWEVAPTSTAKAPRFEVVEYWGAMNADELSAIGVSIPELEDTEEFWVNAWMLGSTVIKVDVQPIDGTQLPYYAYYWDKDETNIFGEGIPAIIRDDQTSLNAAVRAMQDNAAICAGPQVEVNIDLLVPGTNITDVKPFKIWPRNGEGLASQYPAVREVRLESHTDEYLRMAGFFANNIHEATIPSYMHGEPISKGSVGRTASGLSMLMSAAQVTFKDQLFSLDDDVQKPFLRSMYAWNMRYNPNPAVKGDYNIVVRGTSSLVAREIRAQNLDQFANSTLNQFDAPFIDRKELNKQRALVLELGDAIVLDEAQPLTTAVRGILNGQQPANNTMQAGTRPLPEGVSSLGIGGTDQLSLSASENIEGDEGFAGGEADAGNFFG